MSRRCGTLAILLGSLWMGLASHADAQVRLTPESGRRVDLLQGGLYSASDPSHTAVFLVTADGIVVSDLPNRPFALWLKSEPARMFPQLAVTDVLLSHFEPERLDAAGVFADSARLRADSTYVALARLAPRMFAAQEDLVKRLTPLTPEETVSIGGSNVSFVHAPLTDAADATVLWFAREGTAFAMDAPAVGSTPFHFGTLTGSDVLRWLATMKQLPFGYLITGTGESVTKEDIDGLSAYFNRLLSLVSRDKASGFGSKATAARVSSRPDLPDDQARERADHVARLYDSLRVTRADVYAVGAIDSLRGLRETCVNGLRGKGKECSSARDVRANLLGLRISRGSFGMTFEFRDDQEHTAAILAPTSFNTTALVKTREISALFRWGSSTERRWQVGILAGPSFTMEDGGYAFPRGVSQPTRSPFAVTAGADLTWTLVRRVQIVAPIRLTQESGGAFDTWPDNQVLVAGIGIGVMPFSRAR